MMRLRRIGIGLLCLALFSTAVLQAQPKQKPFTAKELKRFIADWPAFANWAPTVDAKYKHIAKPDVLFGLTYKKEFKGFLKKRGWSGERFFYVAVHAAAGLAKVVIKDAVPAANAQLAAQMQAIKNNPNISEAQKQQMLTMMSQAQAQMKDAAPQIKLPAQELKLVKAHRTQLEKIFDMTPTPQ